MDKALKKSAGTEKRRMTTKSKMIDAFDDPFFATKSTTKPRESTEPTSGKGPRMSVTSTKDSKDSKGIIL